MNRDTTIVAGETPGFLHRFLTVATQHPDAIAIEMLDDKIRLTYAELRARAELACGALASLGIEAGDRILVILPNSIAFVTTYIAAIGRGAIPVLVNDKLTEHEFGKLAAHAAPKAIVTTSKLLAKHAEAVAGLASLRVVATVDGRPQIDAPAITIASLADAHAPVALQLPEGDPIVTLQFTYKGLGRPLLVGHRYRALTRSTDGIHEDLHAQGVGSCHLTALPLYAVFGLTMLMVFPLSVGATMVMTNSISRHNIVQLLSQHRITFACLVPDLLRMMSEQLRPGRGPAERPPLEPKLMVYSGGSHLSADVSAELSERLGGIPVLQGYGLTECMPVMMQSSHRPGTPGALGRPIRCTEARVVDSDGKDVEPGQTGELLLRGPTVAEGYVGDREATARFFRDGWLHTGDLVARTAEGEIGFLGRRLRITKVMAQMIDLAEVESAATSHPAVRRARARVVRDAQGRNSVALSVVVGEDSTLEVIAAHLSARLAAFKRPRHVEVVPASEATC